MTGIEDLVKAALSASTERRDAALRILSGQLAKSEPYLTLRGLARATGFGVTTLRRWKVPSHAIGGARRYKLSEVQEYFGSKEFQRRLAALRGERKLKKSASFTQEQPAVGGDLRQGSQP